MSMKYKRVLIKLSGEALAGDKTFGLDYPTILEICKNIKQAADLGAEIGIVVGGGNFWRRRTSGDMERTRADQIGMLATVMNALSVADALEHLGLEVRVQTALQMNQVAEPYIRNKAVHHMEKGRVVIIACGSGNPYFSTDTAAVLRAAEIGAEVVLFAKNIDGVYSADPKKDPNAVKYDEMTYDDIIHNDLAVIDSTASTFGRDNKLPILIFGLNDPENIYRAINGETLGTIVHN